MTKHTFNHFITTLQQPVTYLIKWLLLGLAIGLCVGSASAFFLVALNGVTNWRESHVWIIALLPLGGLFVGLLYHYLGKSVVKGNNQLLKELHTPQQIIPLRMAPLVLMGTLATHLFGGSAGREGTAVQMGGAIADRFTYLFGLSNADRKIILLMGISAGFASVFGTPLAGALFALEVMLISRNTRLAALLPCLLAAFIAHYTCLAWQVGHTHYSIPKIPLLSGVRIAWTVAVAVLFGLTAWLFSFAMHFFSRQFNALISYAPLRPMLGGIIIALVVYFMGTTKYIGLGIPTIIDSFTVQQPLYAFLIKLLLTAFTLGAGFKGGEVTPLFFVGATLGSALFLFVPLPMALLAGMGFVAVFSGATNTPIASTVMAMELFGIHCGPYMAIACIVAYFCSGPKGIYSSQIIGGPKAWLYQKMKQY
jgi:H+/Cl- antiporter ClcA